MGADPSPSNKITKKTHLLSIKKKGIALIITTDSPIKIKVDAWIFLLKSPLNKRPSVNPK